MKKRIIILIMYFIIAANLSVSGQNYEIQQLWLKQIDTCHIERFKSEYLYVDTDKMLEIFNKQPSFGIYKDNYFITGIPTNKSIDNQNADAKFQISIRQRLADKVMPFNTQLMLTYTQKSFWDIYEESCPFRDNNYNPSLILVKPVVSKSRLRGLVTFSFEHESNGKNGLENRNWNFFTLSYTHFFNICFSAQTKLWYGWLAEENKDLFRYRGYGVIALNYRSVNDRLGCSLIVNPHKSFISANTQLELSYKINKKSNQYLFLQWHNGYGEGLLDYNKYNSMVRIGICIKPPLRNIF